jgi:hypothetical protein
MYRTISPLGAGITLENITPEKGTKTLSKEVGCDWKGCESQYKGELPPGWRKIVVFKDDGSPFSGEVNGSLCPTHVKELGKSLKAGYKLEVAADESQGAEN